MSKKRVHEIAKELGGKSNGADTKAAASPANPSKHEKAATLNKAIKTDKSAKEQSHKKEAKHDDKKHDDKKSNVRHVQINEPTKKQNNGQKQDGRNHQKQDRPNGNQQGQKSDGQQGQKNDNRHNGNADNRNRNGRVDNRNKMAMIAAIRKIKKVTIAHNPYCPLLCKRRKIR